MVIRVLKVHIGGGAKVLLGRKAIGGGIPMGKNPVGLKSLVGTPWSTLNQKESRSTESSRYSLGSKVPWGGRPLGRNPYGENFPLG